MTTFGMLFLTLLTVLGATVLGWLLRRYMLGGRCGAFGSDEILQESQAKLALMASGGAAVAAAASQSDTGQKDVTSEAAASGGSRTAEPAKLASTETADASTKESADAGKDAADAKAPATDSDAASGKAAKKQAGDAKATETADVENAAPAANSPNAKADISEKGKVATADDPEKLAELEASEGEVRGLRERLGLMVESAGRAKDASLDERLKASRAEASELREQVFSREAGEAESGSSESASPVSDSESGGSGSKSGAQKQGNTDTAELSVDDSEALRLLESGTFVADDSNRPTGLLSDPSDGPKDDLKAIKGVGPKLESLLNAEGVYYYRQIAAFTATDVAWIDTKLRFHGRVVRDNWVGQAKQLS